MIKRPPELICHESDRHLRDIWGNGRNFEPATQLTSISCDRFFGQFDKPSWRNGSASLSYEPRRRRLRVRSSSAVNFLSDPLSTQNETEFAQKIQGLLCFRRNGFYADIVFEKWGPLFVHWRHNALIQLLRINSNPSESAPVAFCCFCGTPGLRIFR